MSQFPPHVQGIFNLGRFEQEANEQAAYPDDRGAAVAAQHELAAAAAAGAATGYWANSQADTMTAKTAVSGTGAGTTSMPLDGGRRSITQPGSPDAKTAASSTGPSSARAARGPSTTSPTADAEPVKQQSPTSGPGAKELLRKAGPGAGFALPKAPSPLHRGFASSEVGAWDSNRFQMVRKLQDATRNRGMVHLVRDKVACQDVAVKKMPNGWFKDSHQEFVREHPTETEMPWQDIGCVNFLNQSGFAYACDLKGVFKDDEHTYVVTSFASEGDMFSWCETGVSPGPEREEVVLPLARQMLEGVQQLHEMGISHLDLSLENILLSKPEAEVGGGRQIIRIIDFGMATNARFLQNCVRGKASYQAPELHTSQVYDAYLCDAFSIGVTLYSVLVKDYPWLSTRPGGCKCFEYVRKHGFRSFLDKRKLRSTQLRVGQIMSEPLKQLLEGLLALDPAERLTLGEACWANGGPSRTSVWDEPWIHHGS